MAAKTSAAPASAPARAPRKAVPAAGPAAPKKGRAPRAKGAGLGAKVVKIKLVRSGIGTPKPQRATLRSLGLTRLNQVRELTDTPIVRGMIFKVRHLVVADPA